MGSYHLVDMHCHLDFMANADAGAHDAAAKGLAIFANTVTPQGFEAAHATLAGASNVRVGVGLHPWWVADGRASWRDVERATERARAARWVGEVGLDFSPAHVPAESEKLQVDALRLVAQACAEGAEATGPKLLSIHAVRSAQTVLDVLEETGCLSSCHCIFHWFSGRSDELHRAVKAGCSFSVNEMMLATKRGREYARQVPVAQLLTETDLPPHEGEPFPISEVIASLERTLDTLTAIRGTDVRERVAANALRLLDLA